MWLIAPQRTSMGSDTDRLVLAIALERLIHWHQCFDFMTADKSTLNHCQGLNWMAGLSQFVKLAISHISLQTIHWDWAFQLPCSNPSVLTDASEVHPFPSRHRDCSGDSRRVCAPDHSDWKQPRDLHAIYFDKNLMNIWVWSCHKERRR